MFLRPCDTYANRAPTTKIKQAIIQASNAVKPSALGVFVLTVLKMLTSARNKVINNAIRPEISSIGITNEIHERITKKPVNF